MALWKTGKQAVLYDASVASGRQFAAYDGSAVRNSRLEPYDQSAAIWPINAMAARPHAPKPCDTNFMKSTMSKKFATVTHCDPLESEGRAKKHNLNTASFGIVHPK
jgi:hypothetical protein